MIKYKSLNDYKVLLEKYGIEMFIENVKVDGILINPYDGKIKENMCGLIDNLSAIIDKRNIDYERNIWEKTIMESKLINKVYREFYNNPLHKKVHTQNPLEAFLLVTEQFLQYVNNIINDEESKNSEMELIFSVIENPQEERKIFYMNLHDILTREINLVLSSLKYYEYPKHVIDVNKIIDNNEIRNAYNHFNNVQMNDLINYAVDSWKYGGREVSNIDEVVIFEIINDLDESYFIINERNDSRTNKIYLFIDGIIREINKKDKNEDRFSDFFNQEEFMTICFLMEYLNVDDLKFCTYRINGYPDSITISELIRSYFLLISICKEKISVRNSKVNSLKNWGAVVQQQEIEKLFIQNGIKYENVNHIIKQLTYRVGVDIFDAPLIKINQGFLLLPNLLMNIDVSKLVLSLISEIVTRGQLFENEIKKRVCDNGLRCNDLYIKDTEEYQCDLAISIADDLYFCECKAWNEFKNITGYYNMTLKMKDTKNQLDRIANKFLQNIDYVNKHLGFEKNHKFKNVYKIVITLNMLGLFRKIDDTYFIDFSSLVKFLDREKPGIRMYGMKPEFKAFKGYKEYEGNINNHKFMSIIRNPANIELTRKNKVLGVNKFKFSDIEVQIPMYAPEHPKIVLTSK